MKFWTACRVLAWTLLAAVLVGAVLDQSAADLVHAAWWLFRVGFVLAAVAGCVVCTVLVAELFVDAWRDR